jgi:undecaprenyl-diphosphatase
MKRKEAGSYSFLMSLPIILAGIFKELPELMGADPERLHILLIGVGTSFIVGFLTIHFFMKVIGSLKLKYFTFYRWVVAGLMLWLLN